MVWAVSLLAIDLSAYSLSVHMFRVIFASTYSTRLYIITTCGSLLPQTRIRSLSRVGKALDPPSLNSALPHAELIGRST